MKILSSKIFIFNVLTTSILRCVSLILLAVSLLFLAGCFSGGGSDDEDASVGSGSEAADSLSVAGDSEVVLGGLMEVKIALNSAIASEISSIGESEGDPQHYSIRLAFLTASDADKFEVNYSDTCYTLDSFNICSITITPKSNAYTLKDYQVGYTVKATSDTKTLATSEKYFTVKALTLALNDEAGIGSGGSGILTVSNDTKLPVDLTGSYFEFQEGNVLLSLSNNSCTGILQAGESCQVLVTADNSAESATTVSLINAGGEKLGAVSVKVQRPVIEILLDQETALEPNHELKMTVHNSSSFPVRGVSLSFLGEQLFDINMTENTCPAILAGHGSCTVTFRSEDKPSGSGMLTVTSDNADAVTQSISGTMPALISTVISHKHISANSHANKEVIVTVTNTSATDTLNNLLLSSPGLDNGLTVMESQSSCVNLYQSILPAGKSCQYVITYIPEEVVTPSSLDELIYLSSDESATTVNTLTINKYPSFYSLPQNTEREQLGLAGYSVHGVFVDGNKLYVATSNGLSISTEDTNLWMSKTSADGLGNNYTNDVVVSGARMYVSTDGGLSMSFDGGRTWINKTSKDGLGGDIVKHVIVSNNHIYAATSGGVSISRDGGNNWINKSVSEGLGDSFVSDILLSDSTLYAATSGGVSISTDSGQTWVNKTTNDGLSSDIILALGVSGDKIYAATNKGLSVSSDHGEIWQSVSDKFDGVSIHSIAVADGSIYVGNDSGLFISKDNGESWGNIPLNGERIYQIVVSGSKIYVSAEDGLYISSDQGESWEAFRVLNSYLTSSQSAYTNAVSVADGVIYLATNGGLSISNDGGKTWVNKNQDDELLSTVVNDVFATESKVYIATNKGLAISSDGGNTWVNKTTENGLADNRVKVVSIIDGVIYAGTANGLSISNDDGNTWVNKTTENGLIGNDITGISASVSLYGDNLTIYIGTTSGLSISKDNGESWVSKTTSNGLLDNNIISLYSTTGSIIAVGTAKGLSLSYDSGQNWEEGFIGDLVTGVYFTTNTERQVEAGEEREILGGSEIYVATNEGLFMSFDGGHSWMKYTVDNGLVNNVLTGVFVSGGNVFVTTTNGLSVMTRAALSWDLLLDDTKQAVSKNAFYASPEKLYFATTNGLYIFSKNDQNLQYISTDDGLPNNKLLSVYANGDVIYVGSLSAGLFISPNGGISWEHITTADGLGSNRIYTVYARGDTVYVLTSAGAYKSLNGADNWELVVDGDLGFYSTMESWGEKLYIFSQKGDIYISDDDGNNWNMKMTPFEGEITGASVFQGDWYIETTYGGFLSYDEGDTWENYDSNMIFGDVFALGNMLYRTGPFHQNQLYVSEDKGKSWYDGRGLSITDSKQALFVSGSTVYVTTPYGMFFSRDLLN